MPALPHNSSGATECVNTLPPLTATTLSEAELANSHSLKYRNHGKPLTAERLRELLVYNPETGVFTWRPRKENPYAAREKAGCRRPDGRWVIRVDGRNYRANRLAWLYINGEWPAGVVDHRNGDHTDDRFANLRDTTQANNTLNRGAQSNNKSGFKGVSLHKGTGKWIVWIRRAGKPQYLGLYPTPEEASAAYELAAVKLHGDFAFSERKKAKAA